MTRTRKVALTFVVATAIGGVVSAIDISSRWPEWQMRAARAGLSIEPSIVAIRLTSNALVWGIVSGLIACLVTQKSMTRTRKVALTFVVATAIGAIQMSSHWPEWQMSTERAGFVFDPYIAAVRLASGALVWGVVFGLIVWAVTQRWQWPWHSKKSGAS